MIPIADQSPKRFLPFVNYLLLALNIFAFFQQPAERAMLQSFFNTYGLVPSTLGEESRFLMGYSALISSMFLHGDIWHLGGNMLYLWIFGDNIEYALGHVRYLLFYLAVGICAALIQVVAFPESTVPMVGASGAISGVLGGYLVKYPRNRVTLLFFFFIIIRIIRVPAMIALGLWFAYQLLNVFLEYGNAMTGGVAWYAHLGGFVAGLLLVKLFELGRR